METKEEMKLEPENLVQKGFSVSSHLNSPKSEPETQLSSLQARRRFMITDILNSAVESAKEQKGLDMRLLFPGVGVGRLPLPHSPEGLAKFNPHGSDIEADSDNEGDDDQDDNDDNDKGLSFSLFQLFPERIVL